MSVPQPSEPASLSTFGPAAAGPADGTLDEQQRGAVLSQAPITLVLAGPGSGKTRVLAHRFRHLVEAGVPRERILVLTFTREAALEMRRRIIALLGAGNEAAGKPEGHAAGKTAGKGNGKGAGEGLMIGTFHSFAWNVVRSVAGSDLAARIGIPDDPELLDGAEQQRMVGALVGILDQAGALGRGPRGQRTFAAIRDRIAAWKEVGTRPADALETAGRERDLEARDVAGHAAGRFEHMAAMVFVLYERLKAGDPDLAATLPEETVAQFAGKVDFADCVSRATRFLEADAAEASAAASQRDAEAVEAAAGGDTAVTAPDGTALGGAAIQAIEHVLIDECQDMNHEQLALLRLMARVGCRIWAVGDEDQAIYGFRGSIAGQISKVVAASVGEPTICRLETNYRASAPLVDAATRFIARNHSRDPKTMRASREGGSRTALVFGSFLSEAAEARWVSQAAVASLGRAQAAASDRPGKIGVMVRNAALAWSVQAALGRVLAAGAAAGMAPCAVAVQDKATFWSLGAVLAVRRGALLALGREDEADQLLLEPGLRGLPKGTHREIEGGLEELVRGLANLARRADSAPSAAWVHGHGLPPAGWVTLGVICDHIDAAAARSELALPWGRATAILRNVVRRDGLACVDVLAYAAAFDTAADSTARAGARQGSITVGTLHAAKGLEFDAAFLMGMEDGIMPSGLKTVSVVEEERRLFYVGATRAIDRLFVTFARHRSGKATMASPFVRELAHAAPAAHVGHVTDGKSGQGLPSWLARSGRRDAADLQVLDVPAHPVAPDVVRPRRRLVASQATLMPARP
jgi:superfamily I DNA/RNA helicase